MQRQINQTKVNWQEILLKAFGELDSEYVKKTQKTLYFPKNFLAPFNTLDKNSTKYILFGQDPYPREESATGYSFIDGGVKSLWSEKGLSKEVNRATSLRNFMKMLLYAENHPIEKEKIAEINRSEFIDSITDLRDNFEKNGVMLLNIVPIFTTKEDTKRHLKEWIKFTKKFLLELELDNNNNIELILFGELAKTIKKFNLSFKTHSFEHPYNISFIKNPEVIKLFKQMRLLYIN